MSAKLSIFYIYKEEEDNSTGDSTTPSMECSGFRI